MWLSPSRFTPGPREGGTGRHDRPLPGKTHLHLSSDGCARLAAAASVQRAAVHGRTPV